MSMMMMIRTMKTQLSWCRPLPLSSSSPHHGLRHCRASLFSSSSSRARRRFSRHHQFAVSTTRIRTASRRMTRSTIITTRPAAAGWKHHPLSRVSSSSSPCIVACLTTKSHPATKADEDHQKKNFPTDDRESHSESSTTGLFFRRVLSKEAATADRDAPTHYRWYAVPPANLVHLAIGSVYVYSMWTPGMATSLGVVAATSLDWNHASILPVFSASAVCLGLTTASLGSWVERVGPRTAGVVGSLFWGSALTTTAVGVHYHSLPLVYTGWGLLGGIGWGLMYLAPVTTVMKWFPDRRGLATGIALSAFGTGAALAPGMIQSLLDLYAIAPDFIGPLAELTQGLASDEYVTLSTLPDGTQVVADHSAVGTPGEHVVVATEADVARMTTSLSPGAYLLGTGDTGTTKAMATLGLINGTMGLVGARFMSMPHPQWTPSSKNAAGPTLDKQLDEDQGVETVDDADDKPKERTMHHHAQHNIGLPVDYVTRQTTQFPLLWLSVFGNAAGGLALLSSSKLMISDIWMGTAPDIVTASFATAYVSALGIGMAVGRFGWSALSDKLGRQRTYAIFGLGIPIVGMAPALAHAAAGGGASSSGMVLPLLSAFCGGSVLAITFYGGIFSVLPAYIADLFGQKHAGAIHGKLLTAWAASAVAGPMGLAHLRSRAANHAMDDLLTNHIAPHESSVAAFYDSFGCTPTDVDMIQTLTDAKTITIARLLDFVPAGTVDPTPFLYDTTCYTAAAMMGVSFVANLLIKPLDVPAILSKLEEQDKNKRDKGQLNRAEESTS